MSLKSLISPYYNNIRGWKTPRKIVVIESDDWGSIRMASKETFNDFQKKGYKVENCPYNTYDGLETDDDLEQLFDTLQSIKDSHGNHPVFTANTIVANPRFDLIEKDNYSKYHYELFTETLKNYPDAENVFSLYKKGIEKKLFFPQFHGREHVNINRWLLSLRLNDQKLLDAFKHKMFTVHHSGTMSCRRDHLDAYGLGYQEKDEVESLEKIVKDGLDQFESIFGYRSESTIAPCYTWPDAIEPVLAEKGVKYLQGAHVQRIPIGENGLDLVYRRHYVGQKNASGQTYLTRNVQFEPYGDPSIHLLDKALREVEIAFMLKKPAIISAHRVNFMGRLSKTNRDANLKLLHQFLKKLVKKHPDVEFLNSVQLGRRINC